MYMDFEPAINVCNVCPAHIHVHASCLVKSSLYVLCVYTVSFYKRMCIIHLIYTVYMYMYK